MVDENAEEKIRVSDQYYKRKFLAERTAHYYSDLEDRLSEYNKEDISIQVGQSSDEAEEVETLYKLPEEDMYELSAFFLTSVAEIEDLTSSLISWVLCDGACREGLTSFIEENFSQKQREDLLYQIGLIGEGLKGEIRRVRGRRNELAHSRHYPIVENIDETVSSIKRAKKAKQKLLDLCDDIILTPDEIGHTKE